jgi:GNAT superfamily N-acetyltransferase
MGWIVHRHGVLYAQEQGWNPLIEAYTAEIVAAFLRRADTQREGCWLAEFEGRRLGSVMLVRNDEHTAQLRLLYVEPEARGAGLGRRLVQECLHQAKRRGYHRMLLLTNSLLLPARGLYQSLGFVCTAQAPSDEFGAAAMSETWMLDWAPP